MTFIKKNILFFLLACQCSLCLFSQDNGPAYQYARIIVDTMASESMHGRGYVNGGDKIAANYIRVEFEKFKLQSFTGSYYQPFVFPVNTFPGEISFEYSFYDKGKTINFKGVPAQNFLISPESPAATVNFSTVVFDSTFTTSDRKFEKFRKKINSENTFVIIDDRGVSNKSKLAYFKKAKAGYFKTHTIELVRKLTWDQAQEVNKYVKIQVLADSFQYATEGNGVLKVENKFVPDHAAQNVIGYVKGAVYPDSFIVFSAHYDHLGQMGKTVYFPGANDNASGCAMLLNLARHYSTPENQPKYSMVFIAFAGEEVGLLGSKYYTENPLFPLDKIRFVLNMDILGTGEDGITVVNGSVFKKQFDALVNINSQNGFLRDIKIRGKAANSDHYFFSEKGVKSFFIYTMGGTKAYHDIYDKPETLPLNKLEDLFKLIIKFNEYLQN
ncbi:MAG: M28 family peptidase [Bacteroidota bacterium]